MEASSKINRITCKLLAIWQKKPELRFFQLLDYLGFKYDNFYLEDAKFEEVLDKELENE